MTAALVLALSPTAYAYDPPKEPPRGLIELLLYGGYSEEPASVLACDYFTPGPKGAPTKAEAEALCNKTERCRCSGEERFTAVFYRDAGSIRAWRTDARGTIEPLEGAARRIVILGKPRLEAAASYVEVMAARETLKLALAVDHDLALFDDALVVESGAPFDGNRVPVAVRVRGQLLDAGAASQQFGVPVVGIELAVVAGPTLSVRTIGLEKKVEATAAFGEDRRAFLRDVHRIGLQIGQRFGAASRTIADEAPALGAWHPAGLDSVSRELERIASTSELRRAGLLEAARAWAYLALLDSRAAPLGSVPHAARALASTARAESYAAPSKLALEIEAVALAGAHADEGALALLEGPELEEVKAFLAETQRSQARRPKKGEAIRFPEMMAAIYSMYVLRDTHGAEFEWYPMLASEQPEAAADLMLYHASFGALRAIRTLTDGTLQNTVSASAIKTCGRFAACDSRGLGVRDAWEIAATLERSRAAYAEMFPLIGWRAVVGGSWRDWLAELTDRAIQVERHEIHNRKILGHQDALRSLEEAASDWIDTGYAKSTRADLMARLTLGEVDANGHPSRELRRALARRMVWGHSAAHPSLYLQTNFWERDELRSNERLAEWWLAQGITSPRIAGVAANFGPAPAAAWAQLERESYFEKNARYLPLHTGYFVDHPKRFRGRRFAARPASLDTVLSVLRETAGEKLENLETRAEGVQMMVDAQKIHPSSFPLAERTSELLVEDGRLEDAAAVWARFQAAGGGGFLEPYIAKHHHARILIELKNEEQALELSREAASSGAEHRYEAHVENCLLLAKYDEARQYLERWKNHYGAARYAGRLQALAEVLESKGARGWDGLYAFSPLDWSGKTNRRIFEILERRQLLSALFEKDRDQGRAHLLEALGSGWLKETSDPDPKLQAALQLGRLDDRASDADPRRAVELLRGTTWSDRFSEEEWRRVWKDRFEAAVKRHLGRALTAWARAGDSEAIRRTLAWMQHGDAAKDEDLPAVGLRAIEAAHDAGAGAEELAVLAKVIDSPAVRLLGEHVVDLRRVRHDGWRAVADAIQLLWFEGKDAEAYALLDAGFERPSTGTCRALGGALQTLAADADRTEAWARRHADDSWCLFAAIEPRSPAFFQALARIRRPEPNSKLAAALQKKKPVRPVGPGG